MKIQEEQEFARLRSIPINIMTEKAYKRLQELLELEQQEVS